MSEETVSSMHDARDAEDNRLLEASQHTQLLDNYVYLVQEWVALRVRDREAAAEVVQRVFLRLARELAVVSFADTACKCRQGALPGRGHSQREPEALSWPGYNLGLMETHPT